MQDIFIPVLRSFTNENPFYGSSGNVRFCLVPDGEEIHASIWYGKLSMEKSVIAQEASFPMSEEGLDAIQRFLTDCVEEQTEK